MKKKVLFYILLASTFFLVLIFSPLNAAEVSITNGTQFKDTSGNVIHAHGGGVVKYEDYYYWYGEYRDSNNKFLGVRCYRSTDLKNWEFRGEVLKPSSAGELNSCNVERPKVMYNESTNQFVMWMHWENGQHYGEARAAVAYCNTPDGDFTYQGSFRPYSNSGITDHDRDGYMSRDCNVFVDTDGTGYFISSSNENMDLHLYRLTYDYKDIEVLVAKLFVGKQREAPCLFKRNGYYYLLTSGCTGWEPNQAKYTYSKRLDSGWSDLINIGNSTTYSSQPAFVLSVQGSNTYLYMGDRWAGAWGGKVNDSQYVWLPLVFNSDTSLSLPFSNSITIDIERGYIGSANEGIYKIVNKNSGKVLDIEGNSNDNGANVIQWTDNGESYQQWQLINLDNGSVKFVNNGSGKVLEVKGWSNSNGGQVAQWSDNGGSNQHWKLSDAGSGYYKIVNHNSGKLLDVSDESRNDGGNVIQYSDTGGSNQHWQLEEVQ
ncbi:MAG: RICIN domain-containing protein [Desulfobacteraceae bacterium]|jgi:hypothetical protein